MIKFGIRICVNRLTNRCFSSMIMKSILIILIFSSSYAYGQRRPRYNIDEVLKKGDSLEVLYKNDSHLKIISDTTFEYPMDWDNIIRSMNLVSYYYDSSNVLKKVFSYSRSEGRRYFYFEGIYIRKVRVLKLGDLINLQYYFTDEDNKYAVPEIEQRMTRDIEVKDLYELLKMGKSFLNKFKTLL